MTLHPKARHLLMGVLLIALGVVGGLALSPAPSRAQNVGGQASYIETGGQYWFCVGRDCVPVRFNQYG